jgi:YfiH family protein
LGDHVGDVPQAVQTNRQRLQVALQANTPQVQTQAVFLRQVHGVQTIYLTAGLHDGHCADACITTAVGPVCTIMVADCLPVLFTDLQGRAVAAAHAGWRGLADGVLESVWQAFCTALLGPNDTPVAQQVLAQSTLAWLGPCIGPTAFEVGAEVQQAFCAHHPAQQRIFSSKLGSKANTWPIWLPWHANACRIWASHTFMAMTAAPVGVRSIIRHGSFRTGAMLSPWAAVVVWPLASGVANPTEAAASSACCSAIWRARKARLRPGVPKMYTTIDKGKAP